MIGRTISHYKILEKLGESGMSSLIYEYNNLNPPKEWRTGRRTRRCCS